MRFRLVLKSLLLNRNREIISAKIVLLMRARWKYAPKKNGGAY